MSRRYLLPLAVAAVLATPLAATAAQGDWLVRVGMSGADPKESNLENVPGLGGDAVLDWGLAPTANVSYMLSDHIATELLLALPFTHGVDLKTGGGGVQRVGYVDHIPPTLSLQWHFNPDGAFRPYIGVGINYTIFSGEELRGVAGGPQTKLSLEDSFGPAAQLGADFAITKNWFVNADMRWIDIDADAEVREPGLPAEDVGTVEIDPFIYGLHVGYRFGRPEPTPEPAPEPVAAPPPPPPPPPPAPADSDGDGVPDSADKCPNTPAGTKVDSVGCPLEQTLKLLFDFDSAELRPESITELERVVSFMGDVPFAAALVEGHTDSVGADGYNLRLSERRAKAVFDYLTSRGVDPSRLSSVGKGETAPIADNANEEGRQLNRRVMLIRTDSGR